MDLFIHYTALPEGMTLEEVVEGLNEVMDDGGVVNDVVTCGEGGRIDMDLEEETHNPKLAQGSVKSYVMRVGFPRDTVIELGGMKINAYY
ncbi:MAG: hypothetical protein E7450_04965 [Ruminococcaceae bacterium]|nr:hypothetical protein [Oscillospiraceae bacterium]